MFSRRSKSVPTYVLEYKSFETARDITPAMRENLFKLTRTLRTVRQVNVTRRVVEVSFKSFHSEAAKRADLLRIELELDKILATAAP